MGLIALPADFLKLHTSVPFGIYDAHGRLLVAAGRVIDEESRLAALQRRDLFVDEQEAGPWRAGFHQTAQDLIKNDGATLAVIAAARTQARPRRPGLPPSRSGSSSRIEVADPPPTANAPLATEPSEAPAAPTLPVFSREGSLTQRHEAITKAWSAVLRDAAHDPHWLARTLAVRDGMREFARFHRDAAVYLLLQHAAHSNEHYCAHHSLLCMLICDSVSQRLGMDARKRDALALAALTMNISMAQLQDQLAQRDDPIRPDQRKLVASHADRSAEMLISAGVTDQVVLTVVCRHHEPGLERLELSAQDSAVALTKLLSMVDRFTAKISRRGSRAPLSPLAAARDICVSPDGQPDPLGSALLKVMGMYPAGSYVRLASGEVGVVVACGRRMNQPMVATFVAANGMPTTEPLLRDTALEGRGVTGAVPVGEVRVRVSAERALALA